MTNICLICFVLSDDRYRQSTGIVWEGCRKIELLPLDNKAAVTKALMDQNKLVDDAFNEISEVSFKMQIIILNLIKNIVNLIFMPVSVEHLIALVTPQCFQIPECFLSGTLW